MSDNLRDLPSTRRERLGCKRTERILGAAAGIFARKGFCQATLHDIAVMADVG